MTTKEITELCSGTTVYLIADAVIQPWATLGFHPRNNNYFYVYSKGNVDKTKALFLESNANYHWETDYEKAKEVMWEQLQIKVNSINKVFMDGKKYFSFDKSEEIPLSERQNFISSDFKTARNSYGECFTVGDIVEHQGSDDYAVIERFQIDVDSNEIKCHSSFGWAHIDFINKV